MTAGLERWGTMKKMQSREYQMLLNNIPGGVVQCLHDGSYTLVEVNQGFLDLVGFSEREIAEQFQGHVINMIHPDDRGSILAQSFSQRKRKKVTLNYRILCRDGGYKWVMDNCQLIENENGEERIFCVLLDITESKNAREELRLTLERHQMILDQAADIIFEWDVQSDTVIFSSNWEKKFGYKPCYGGLDQQQDFIFPHVHPDDTQTLKDTMLSGKKGNPYPTAEARIQNADGQYIWCRVRATQQYDSYGKPLKAVGVITDIDTEKRMIDDLRQRAERDALTGIYNREEMERQICRHMEAKPEGISALFIIDADNFKLVNDTQGHLFGDAVLSELAAGMKKLTRQTDVVGRIGGDEFMIYLKDIPSDEIAKIKVEKLIEMFQSLFQEGKQQIEITCSVGIALYPEHGADFQTLYRNADLALYQAKSNGKNQFVIYDPERAVSINQTGYSSLGAAIDSDVRDTIVAPSDLVNYVFQILYDTADIDHAIHLILEIVGKRFDVSRAYILETSDDEKYISNTYEWCNEGVRPEKENLQNIPLDQTGGYLEQFEGNSILYCRDIHQLSPEQAAILEAQGVCSILHCAIIENGKFYGVVGFDECTGIRLWTKEEISVLSLVSQLITTFLLKLRAAERDQQMTLRLNTILDAQSAYIYAIEHGTYELLYLNDKTKALDPKAKVGMTCYQAFFSRSVPCENCPIVRGTGEMYNPRYDVWVKAQFTQIKWGAVDAYLLSCYDVTEYKRMQEHKS